MSKRKRLGQHFLIDESAAKKIVDSASLSADDTVIEIGPGAGILTSRLADIAKRVIAIEIDKKLCRLLQDRLSSCSNINIINSNALDYDYEDIPEIFKVVSNLPYSISTPLTIKLIEHRKKISDMVLMFQKEVADRISAKPGTKDYGALSIAVQYHAETAKLMNVGRGAFKPVPKVDSAVIRITPRKEPAVKLKDENLFFKIVKTSFMYRRKTIRNNLKSMKIPPHPPLLKGGIGGLSEELLNQIFKETGINPSRRGETLSISEFADIANYISGTKT
ncbi:MAG: ribosomal RNA small subunit methyltransferase A [Nitrospinae bacterium]|nr:ribosomal RNA small subunit methyltransferase A [Nitrospinota bacterium]